MSNCRVPVTDEKLPDGGDKRYSLQAMNDFSAVLYLCARGKKLINGNSKDSSVVGGPRHEATKLDKELG